MRSRLLHRFKGVAYLDIFGPMVNELNAVLDKTGMAFGAASLKKPDEGVSRRQRALLCGSFRPWLRRPVGSP